MARNNSALTPSAPAAPVQDAPTTDLAPVQNAPVQPTAPAADATAPLAPVADAALESAVLDAVRALRSLTDKTLTGSTVDNPDGVPHRTKTELRNGSGLPLDRLNVGIHDGAYVLWQGTSAKPLYPRTLPDGTVKPGNVMVSIPLAQPVPALLDAFGRMYAGLSRYTGPDNSLWQRERLAGQFIPGCILPIIAPAALPQFRSGNYGQRGNQAFAGTRTRRVAAPAADAPALIAL